VYPSAKYSGDAGYNPNVLPPPLGGAPLRGGDGGDAGESGYVPNLYYSQKLTNKLWYGFGINSPFGLVTEYDDDWVGRYNAIKSDLLTINIMPSLAYKINDYVSIGGGINAIYADGELTNAIDFGLLDAIGALGFPPGTFGLTPGQNDGKAKLTGDDWGFGGFGGILLQPTPSTRVGISYRSKVDIKLEGDVKVRGPLGNTKENATLKVDLPSTLSISALQGIGNRWSVMADVSFTEWSELDELVVRTKSGGRNITTLDWNDTVRYAIGTTYNHSDTWTFRGGLAYDEAPVPNSQKRTARVPDNDRKWVTVGAGYRYSKRLSFDLAYAHLFANDANIKSASSHNPPLQEGLHSLDGKYELDVNMFSAQVTWKFQ
jgi:long-chain fatty acid transport protein